MVIDGGIAAIAIVLGACFIVWVIAGLVMSGDSDHGGPPLDSDLQPDGDIVEAEG